MMDFSLRAASTGLARARARSSAVARKSRSDRAANGAGLALEPEFRKWARGHVRGTPPKSIVVEDAFLETDLATGNALLGERTLA
jgi:hypothetical protein